MKIEFYIQYNKFGKGKKKEKEMKYNEWQGLYYKLF